MELIRFANLNEPDARRFHEPVLALLAACDHDFVPPLSARHSTRQAKLDTPLAMDSQPRGPVAYFEEMAGQSIILAVEKNQLIGLLSYLDEHHIPALGHHKTTYLSTICVRHDYRGRGVAAALYAEFEAVAPLAELALRTWSSNVAQMTLLAKRGYREAHRIVDDRGEGIDTVYFTKSLA